MNRTPYPYDRVSPSRYIFKSEGKRLIVKAVDFTHTGIYNLFNIGFGDLLEDGTVDDKSNSNNGDIIAVIATVIDIIQDFSNHHPKADIYFTGSTKERITLYRRLLKNYYLHFSKQFMIIGLKDSDEWLTEELNEKNCDNYLEFIIKRND